MRRRLPDRIPGGIGTFPPRTGSPTLCVIVRQPLHSADEWEMAGRPFWLVRYTVARSGTDCPVEEYRYSRTMTPTYCTLAIIAVPPIRATAVDVGVPAQWVPAPWQGYSGMCSAQRAVSGWRATNPVRIVHVDDNLTQLSAALYAAPGDIRRGREVPVRQGETQYRPPHTTDPLPDRDLHQLTDDGCPHTPEA